MQTQKLSILQWILRIVAATIMLQTLYFKFSGSEESVYIFTQMNMESWGRYATGIAELVASLFILYTPLTLIGALLSFAIMSGAVMSHVFVLGIEVKEDGGLLFTYALVVWIAALVLLWMNRIPLQQFFERLKKGA